MKFTNAKKIGLITGVTTMMSTVVNATTLSVEAVERSLGDWVSIVAEVLTVLCLLVFSVYLARFFSVKNDKTEENEKVVHGVKNGMMTGLIGIAICQAAIVVAKLFF